MSLQHHFAVFYVRDFFEEKDVRRPRNRETMLTPITTINAGRNLHNTFGIFYTCLPISDVILFLKYRHWLILVVHFCKLNTRAIFVHNLVSFKNDGTLGQMSVDSSLNSAGNYSSCPIFCLSVFHGALQQVMKNWSNVYWMLPCIGFIKKLAFHNHNLQLGPIL